MATLTFRKAKKEDIPYINLIYENAKIFMHESGNHTQCINGYPGINEIEKVLEHSRLYVGEDESGEIAVVFVFIIGEDPTYKEINGEWLNEEPYGTIHRIASSGKHNKTLDSCLDFCFKKINNVRIDTHKDNFPMLNALKRNGFQRCGIIICANGTEREAFQRLKSF